MNIESARISGIGYLNRATRFLPSVALSVPTALSMMVQIQCPAYANGGHQPQIMVDHAQQLHNGLNSSAQERRENRLSARDLRQQSFQQARVLRQQKNDSPRVLDISQNPVDFDLDSRSDVFTLTQDDLQGATSISLVLGGHTAEFHAGDRVSAAEYADIRGGSASSLVLDSRGRADGGSFSLNSIESAFTDLNVSKVVIPTNVTAFGDFSNTSNLQLHGDLVNNGAVVTFSSNANNTAGTLNASNFINHHGGSIVTANSQSIAGANDNFSLTLDAANDISNEGTIKASGALNLVAGSGIINNSGVISSSTSNINISSHSQATAIVVNGAGGVFDAGNGAINIRSAQDLNGGDVSMYGGDYLSKQLNIYAAQGNAYGDVGKVTGDLQTQALTQHFYAATDKLTLGNNNVTGDPTFVNATGSIEIDGSNSFSESVAIVAAGDIYASNSGSISSSGHQITMIAGATVTTTGSQTSSIPGTKATADVVVKFDPATSSGGSIDFSHGDVFSIDSSSSTGAGGNVILAALASASGNGGAVTMGSHIITTQSLANATNSAFTGGNLTVIAGKNPTAAADTISLGAVRTSGALGAKGGDITLLTEQPIGTKNNTVTIDKAGTIKTGNIKGSGILLDNAGISTGELTSVGLGAGAGSSNPGNSGGSVDVEAGGNIAVNSAFSYGTGGAGSGAGGAGGNVTLISKNGNITASTLSSAGGGGGGSPAPGRPGGAGGAGGSVVVSAAKGTISLGAIFAGNGGAGGAFSTTGGGGGGSFGGGGGGGSYAGGGGGYYGGGGGSVSNGGGGNFLGGDGGAGGGGVPAASAGNGGVGGNAASGNGHTGGAGGNIGKGGQGAKGSGLAGSDAINSGSVTITSLGDVTVTGGVQGFGDLKVTTTSGNFASGVLLGNSLTFQSQTGSFGTAAAKVPTFITGLTVQTNPGGTGSTGFYAFNGQTNTIINNVSLAGRTFDYSSQGSITTASTGLITADTTYLQSLGNINVSTATKTLTVLAQNAGSATVVNTGDVFLQDSEGNKGFSLTAVAPTASSSAVIHLQGQILNTAGSVTLKVDGPAGSTLGIVEESTKTINAASLSLIATSAGDFGTSAKPLLTQAAQLSASSFGSVYIQNTGSVQVNPTTVGDVSNAAGSEFVLVTTPDPASKAGRITLGNGIGGGLTVRGTNSKLTLQGSGNPGTAGIYWNGTANNLLVAGNISLSDGVGGAGNDNIGIATNPILTQASKTLAVNTQANAFISNTGNVTVLDSKLSDPSTYLLKNTGTITASGKVTAGNIIISSTGDVGTSANPLAVAGVNLSASSSSGSVFINDSASGTINLLNQTSNAVVYKNTALATYSVTALSTGLLTNAGAISAKDVALSSTAIATATAVSGTASVSLSATTGNISVGQTLSGAAVNIAVAGTSTIVQNATGVINASTLGLTLVDGVANLQSANNTITGLNDSVSGSGQVLLKTVSSCQIGSISGDKQTLTIAYSGTLSTKSGADFSVGPLSFTPNVATANNSILIQNKITTGNTLTTLTASGNGNLTISATGALLGAGPKNLTVDTGLMSIGGALQSNQILLTTHGGSISQTASGVITVPGEVSLVMTNGGTAALDTASNVFTTFKDNITGAGNVSIKVAGDLVLFQIIGSNQSLKVNAAGNIIGPSGADTVDAKTLNLTAGGAGGIASGGSRLLTNATDITLNATNTTGNVFATASSTGVVTLRSSTAGGTFDLDSDGSIAVAGTIGSATTNQVKLTADKTGSISETSDQSHILGLSAILASSGGSIIGTDATNGLNLSVGELTVNTTGSGSVNIASGLTAKLTLDSSSAGRSFTLSAIGPLMVGDLTTTAGAAAKTGSIAITTTDSITIGDGSQVSASGGDITFTAGASGTIAVGANSKILASSTAAGVGTVKFITGIAGLNTKGKTPGNVIVNETLGGKVFFGTNSISASAPDNTLNAAGRNIIFSGSKAGAISLNGGVTITADPPAGSAAELALIAAMGEPPRLGSSAISSTPQVMAISSTTPDSNAVSSAPAVSNATAVSNTTLVSNAIPISNTMPVSLSLGTSLSVVQPTLIPLPSQSLDLSQVTGGTPAVSNGQSCATGVDQLGEIPTYTSAPRVVYRFGEAPSNRGIIEAASVSEQESSSDGTIAVTNGNVLCAPVSAAAVLNTKFGALTIAPNSLVLAMATDDGLAVFNLDDRCKHSVTLEHDHQRFSVAPGQHLFITNSNRDGVDFADINVNENILYADLQKTKLRNGHHLFNGQFYIPSVIDSVRPLRALVSSKDRSSATRTNRLLKTTAVLMQLQGGVSNYQRHSRRSITAWSP